jgi:hypothetical protein
MDDVTDSPEPSEPRDEVELAHEWGEVAEVEHDIAWNEDLHDDLLGDFDDDDDFDEPSSEPGPGRARRSGKSRWRSSQRLRRWPTYSSARVRVRSRARPVE